MSRIATLVILAAGAAASVSVQAQTFIDNARVRGVAPQYEQVSVPRQECSTHWVTEPGGMHAGGVVQQYGPALIGGAAGAAVGRQFGGGSGRDIATVVGAVAGAFAGNSYANGNRWGTQPQPVQRQVQQCRTVHEVQSRLTGYLVDYDYRGQRHSTLMPQNPGSQLQVRVSVEPVVR